MAELKTQLLPHQAAAVEKLSKLKVGALYMEQGTGKTRTTLSLIKPRMDAGKVDCVLWLCPCSVRRNLREDIAYHCGGSAPDNLVIRGIESLSSSDKLYLQLLQLVGTHKVFLVVDESNLVKNKMAIRTSRIIELSSHCEYKLILNGTPVSKNEADLFAQWYILDWRILGYKSYYSFAANHLEYWTIRRPDGSEYVDKTRIKNVLNVDYLTEKIAPYTYQVKKDECLELPRKTYSSITYDMTDEQWEIYQEVKAVFLENVDEFRSETIYKLFSACQHVLSGRAVTTKPTERMRTKPIFDNPSDNPRLQAFMGALDRISGEKCIVFCKYQSEIDEISQLMDENGLSYVVFTGKVSQRRRQENREKFHDEAQFFLSNKSCGAYGLNLQFCHNIIYYSNDFDLATRMQSEDRVHRMGQTEEVHIIDLYAPGTLDEFIITCLARKENLAEAFKREISKRKDIGMKIKYGQINIGYTKKQKEDAIEQYLLDHGEVQHVIVFYPDKWEHLSVNAEYTPYSEIIMYRTFYPYLQKIDNTYLLVYDECMRTKKRNDLTYNCAHKYNNQTDHVMVFEWFPYIEKPEEFMILADLIDHVRMRPRKFDASVFDDMTVCVRKREYSFECSCIPLPDGAQDEYEKKKKDLFDNLGKRDPDTVSNALELFVGKYKKPHFEWDKEYVARNSRYKSDNISTFAQHRRREECVLIDLPLRQRDFNDFLKLSGCRRMTFLHTGLPVDNYFFDRYSAWFKEVEDFCEAASLHKRKRP